MTRTNEQIDQFDFNDPSVIKSLAQLKEAVAMLWRQVDAAKTASTENSKQVQEKIETWNQTNRVLIESNQRLLELIVVNSQEVQRSTRSYEQGTQIFTALQSQLESLRVATIELSETLEFSPPAAAAAAVENQPKNDSQNYKLEELHEGLSRALTNLQGLQGIFSQSVEAQIQKLNEWSQENEKILPQTQTTAATWKDKLSPLTLGLGAAGAIGLVGLGMAIALMLPRLAQTESDRAVWANSQEGQLAYNILKWNDHKLGNMECLKDQERLGVTLKVDGRAATSGFCTVWVVPPEQRIFSDK